MFQSKELIPVLAKNDAHKAMEMNVKEIST